MALWLFCGVQTNAENKSRMDARTDEKGSRTRKSPAFSPLVDRQRAWRSKTQEMNPALFPNMGL